MIQHEDPCICSNENREALLESIERDYGLEHRQITEAFLDA